MSELNSIALLRTKHVCYQSSKEQADWDSNFNFCRPKTSKLLEAGENKIRKRKEVGLTLKIDNFSAVAKVSHT